MQSTAKQPLIALLFLAISVLCLPTEAAGDQTRTVFVVRHAEKASEPKKDPPLTEEGRQRADLLSRTLIEANVYGLFATELKRSSLTLVPIATELGLMIDEVESDNPYGMAERVLESGYQVSVVSAHSDTVLQIIQGLGVAEIPPPPVLYDDLFVVTIPSEGKASVIRLKYGLPDL